MSAQIEMGLARNENCVFEDHKVYLYKPSNVTGWWFESPVDTFLLAKRFFHSMAPTVNVYSESFERGLFVSKLSLSAA